MNGERNEQKRGSCKSAVHGCVQGRAVRLGDSIGGNQAAKRLRIPESSLWNWIRLSRAGKLKAAEGAATPVKRSVNELEAENARLRKELGSAKLDLEIVK